MRASLRSIPLVLLMGLSAVGCGQSSPDPSTHTLGAEPVSVESTHGLTLATVAAVGGHLAQGPNALHVDLDAVTAELLSASAFMPVHGHDAPAPSIARETTGFRVSDLVLSMPGLWDITLGVQVDGQSDSVVFTVDVPMKSALGAALLAPAMALFAASEARACPCQGSSGAAAGVTTRADRVGASVTETARVAQGAFLANGRYAPLADGSHESSLAVSAILGARPVPLVELAAETAIGHEAFSTSDVGTRATGFGDTSLRARWELLDEPMAYERRPPWPSVTLVGAVRLPTASSGQDASSGAFSGRVGAAGGSASSDGLGAVEPALGVSLARSLGERWQLSGFVEAAYRLPDSSLAVPRHLGPRVLGELGARYAPTPGSGLGVLADLGWEGEVSYRGAPHPDTDQRLWTLGAFAFFRAEPTKLRWGAMVRFTPPLDGAGKNAVSATSLAVSLGYVL